MGIDLRSICFELNKREGNKCRNLTDDEKKEIEKAFKNKYTGMKNAGMPLLLDEQNVYEKDSTSCKV